LGLIWLFNRYGVVGINTVRGRQMTRISTSFPAPGRAKRVACHGDALLQVVNKRSEVREARRYGQKNRHKKMLKK
jgi:hypothetical protein